MRWHRLIRAINFIPDKIQAKISPVAYAKRKGVNINGKVYFYGIPKLSTEPWLITMGDNVHITKNVEFLTHDGGVLVLRKIKPDLEITKPITIGNDVYIGINSVIMPGVTIGNRCIVGAGSIVTKDVPDDCVVAGVPAKFIKTIDEYYKSACNKSLEIGDLSAIEKEKELKRIFKISE